MKYLLFEPKVDERSAAINMVKRTANADPFIVTMDRGYSSFNMFNAVKRHIAHLSIPQTWHKYSFHQLQDGMNGCQTALQTVF